MIFERIILLCRPGFEKECAGEIIELANQHGFPAYIQTSDTSGVVNLISSGQSCLDFTQHVHFHSLVFARQWLVSVKDTLTLPESNRLPDILKAINDIQVNDSHKSFHDVELNYPDTNEGKSLSKFCKQFKPHLLAVLKKKHWLSAQSNWHLQLFFTDSCHVNIGITPLNNGAKDVMGIPRLKMPGAAPSRSTLKLDEAIQWFLSTRQQSELFKSGMKAVDLGAAPGGWSWQLVQRGCLVTAIDNGPMQDELMKSGMIEHLKTDAFTYLPKKKINWLVCDMAERPLHVSRLMARWFTGKHCEHAIFNLKLPMKKRLASVQECIQLLHQQLSKTGIKYQIQAKQLYHDRGEITVCIITNS